MKNLLQSSECNLNSHKLCLLALKGGNLIKQYGLVCLENPECELVVVGLDVEAGKTLQY